MMAKSSLEELTQLPVIGFAYPNGYESPDFLRVVKDSRYKYGFTGAYGVLCKFLDWM
jgi:peptidoglycan/xylan/chitin deacetylase (PgdA/CDA1 family)